MPETCQNKLHLLITLKKLFFFFSLSFTGGEALCVLAALNLFSPFQLRTFLLWHRITWVIMKEHSTKKKKPLVRFNRLLIVFEAQRSRHTGCPRRLTSSIEASSAVLLSFTSTSASIKNWNQISSLHFLWVILKNNIYPCITLTSGHWSWGSVDSWCFLLVPNFFYCLFFVHASYLHQFLIAGGHWVSALLVSRMHFYAYSESALPMAVSTWHSAQLNSPAIIENEGLPVSQRFNSYLHMCVPQNQKWFY